LYGQTALIKDPGVSVNRIIWSPDGSLFGKLMKVKCLFQD